MHRGLPKQCRVGTKLKGWFAHHDFAFRFSNDANAVSAEDPS